MSDSTLLDAIAILADWRRIRAFSCIALLRMGEDAATEYDLHAEPNHSSYLCVERITGRRFSYDDYARTRETAGLPDAAVPYQFNSEMWAARLAFPMSLNIWGRPGDTYRMVEASRTDDLIHVRLEAPSHPGLEGILIVDEKHGIARELDTPELSLQYRNIQQPVPNRFWPRS
ncbi:MAG: hypothetical protein QM626_01960 [Microbacterium sp.]|uniref:hypothetical protein n=1 Tax=Microbacterium sp. TaxID=51671 RepID=UPI0039E32FFE